MKLNLFVISVLLSLAVCIQSRTVTAAVKNEWSLPLVLSDFKLLSGTWASGPLKNIPRSSSYLSKVFAVSGDSIDGYVTYYTSDKFAHATFYFTNEVDNSTFTTKAGPSPYIGGVDDVDGDDDVSVQYWVHQMCSEKGGDCKN